MRKSKFTDDQKLAILAEHDSGVGVAELSRKHTFYKWKKEYEENQGEDKRQIKELEAENARLKKMFANLSMDHKILKEGWAMDFVSDWVVGPQQKQVRIINIMDEGSRRALCCVEHFILFQLYPKFYLHAKGN